MDREHDENEAYKRGASQARIDARLSEHDRRLDLMTGSMAETATELRRLREGISSLESSQQRRDAVSSALEKAVKESNNKQVSTRTFLLGLAGIFLALATLILSVAH